VGRSEKLAVFKAFTNHLATLSKCTERKVAAIITDYNLTQVYSIGINGGPKDLDDCMCVTDGKFGCLHAEINALIKCKVMAQNKIMIVSLSPCKQCAAAIINEPGGFNTVYYMEEWKYSEGLKLLKNAGINTLKI